MENRIKLIKKIVLKELEGKLDYFQLSSGPYFYIDKPSLKINLALEIKDEGNIKLWKEILTVIEFKIFATDNSEIPEGIFLEETKRIERLKWAFIKIRFVNPKYKKILTSEDITETQVEISDVYSTWDECLNSFKKEFEFYTNSDFDSYDIYIDEIDFINLFTNQTV